MVSLTHIGHTLKPQGKEGLIRLRIEEEYIEDLQSANAIFLDLDGSRVPFLYSDLQIKNHLLVKLDEVDDPQEASKYTSKLVFIETQFVSEKEEDESDFVEKLIGYKVYNSNDIYVGAINGLVRNPHQILLEINTPEKLFLMPFHSDLVIDINEASGTIKMEIIAGIEDL